MKDTAGSSSGSSAIDELSPRRREILQLMATGSTNDEIAAVLGVTPGTVRTHITALFAHLHVTNRTEAAAAYVAWSAAPTRVEAVMRRPAIAVLPLVALGEGAGTMAAGLTEDLVSLLSRWCWFPVIATASSGTARTLGTTNQEIATTLGARFLGSRSRRVSPSFWLGTTTTSTAAARSESLDGKGTATTKPQSSRG
ncbi:MAG TPA: LuxR C-terminal-related transcriptional regulator [Labilithrix sp.]|nr:LuxR C-terminal-related transcriptional regulator [Labilithrix sp.]